jgi:hypothetical protein
MSKTIDFVSDNGKHPEIARFCKEVPSTVQNEAKGATCVPEPVLVSPTKKHVAVHWSDLGVEQHLSPKSSLCVTDSAPHKNAFMNRQTEDFARRYRSSSPAQDAKVTLEELEFQLKKKETKILHACKLELYFLDNMNKARGKRMKMVTELKEIRRQLRKLSEEAAQKDHFVLPPVPSDCANGNSQQTLTECLRLKDDSIDHR